MKKNISFPFLLLFFLSHLTAEAVTKIKFATVAPEGTTWMKAMRKFDKALREQTEGRVQFVFFPGGIAGDEGDVLRKMRYGKIHASGLTGLGSGKILPESRVLDLPFLFQNWEEVDKVHEGLFDFFAEKFNKKGFVLLGWVEVGWIYLFSSKNLENSQKYPRLKIWNWEGDPISLETFRAFGMNPISLSIADVMTSLQTGLLDTVYSPPLALIALQWNTKITAMLKTPLVHSSGVLLLTKKQFGKISKTDQVILKTLGKSFSKQLNQDSRIENDEAIHFLEKQGVRRLSPDAHTKKKMEEVALSVQNTLPKKLSFDLKLLERVLALKNH